MLSGRVAIVTGAGRVLEVRTVRATTDETRADEVVATIRAGSGEVVPHRGLVSDSAAGNALVASPVDDLHARSRV